MCRLNCADLKTASSVDGPGIRSVLFVQGCSRNCPGCQNTRTHSKSSGYIMSIEEVYRKIKQVCRNKRITISGGEPLEQPEAVFELLQLLKEDNFNTCLYTGNVIANVPDEILHYLDYIKCGPFRMDLMTVSRQFYGSSNQVFYSVKNGTPTIYKAA